MATAFQKLSVDHVPFPLDANGHGQSAPLDYPSLAKGGFKAVYFRPEEGSSYVAQRMNYCTDQGFDANVWFADPQSSDSQHANIPGDAAGWAGYVATFVAELVQAGHRPTVLKLNIEFSGKGYPPWKGATSYPQWSHITARTPDGIDRLFYASTGGQTGTSKPFFKADAPVRDGQVVWYPDPAYASGYPQAGGWKWNEVAAKTLWQMLSVHGLDDQAVIIQPMSHQADFNHGAWMSRKARNSPQCYGDQPYHQLSDPGAEIEAVVSNSYVPLYYNGFRPDRRLVHPTIGAYGQGAFYAPRIALARKSGIFGFGLYRHDALSDSDYSDYRQFVVP